MSGLSVTEHPLLCVFIGEKEEEFQSGCLREPADRGGFNTL